MARGLGRGLDAFFPEIEEHDEEMIQEIAISECRPNPYQPRKTFHADAIEELKDSILEYGIIQPLIVRKSIKGYEIVVGERRFRAAKEAGLKVIPAVVKELSDEKMMELALLENLQREDLTAIEEAQAYANLMRELDLTQDELSKRLGKSRSHIANIVRLLSLPDQVVAYINNGELSMGHGRALLGLKDKDKLMPCVHKIRKEKLNVRQVEKLITLLNEKPVKKKQIKKDIFIQERESILRDRLGTAVNINRGKRKGKIEIEFYTDDDLERIIELLETE
ncbi:ParB/RepB/Spo0J family partition protein [Ornithinibacillus gellani]|uniref:ParB/RepB/Spo0J family partition protein n=1 Tax=Ornithinibacillus gellani TaxID=2293253 RepID=UPI000F469B20|nr:ParB/RepB/Spo0J family partition protein [Ornithinibacillus gellani]TQS76342.1 ParB/RepB/Spo0J family partition protein [Ornithinibacillus gellani]